jgi:hypothetical protein
MQVDATDEVQPPSCSPACQMQPLLSKQTTQALAQKGDREWNACSCPRRSSCTDEGDRSCGSPALALALGPIRLWAIPARLSPTKLVIVLLRGGYDAVSLLVLYNSAFYYESRPNIAIPARQR